MIHNSIIYYLHIHCREYEKVGLIFENYLFFILSSLLITRTNIFNRALNVTYDYLNLLLRLENATENASFV